MIDFHLMLGRQVIQLVSTSASLLYLSCGMAVSAPPPSPPVIAVAAPAPPPRVEPVALPVAPWAVELAPLKVECANTGENASIRLYGDDGSLDAASVEAFSRVAADFNGYSPLNPRLVQLAVKAAQHFHASRLGVVSAFRQKRGGKVDHHTAGEALDFKLPGVDYRKLAGYLRGYPPEDAVRPPRRARPELPLARRLAPGRDLARGPVARSGASHARWFVHAGERSPHRSPPSRTMIIIRHGLPKVDQ